MQKKVKNKIRPEQTQIKPGLEEKLKPSPKSYPIENKEGKLKGK